jgi:hypothetical protein
MKHATCATSSSESVLNEHSTRERWRPQGELCTGGDIQRLSAACMHRQHGPICMQLATPPLRPITMPRKTKLLALSSPALIALNVSNYATTSVDGHGPTAAYSTARILITTVPHIVPIRKQRKGTEGCHRSSCGKRRVFACVSLFIQRSLVGVACRTYAGTLFHHYRHGESPSWRFAAVSPLLFFACRRCLTKHETLSTRRS